MINFLISIFAAFFGLSDWDSPENMARWDKQREEDLADGE
jgi:hypothetical protein